MNTKTVLACSAVIIAFALIVAPLAISQDASAGGNKASQKIEQKQSNKQSSQSVGGGGNFYLVTISTSKTNKTSVTTS
ncbi:MAG: hypothetical protein P0116_03885 [Candidatus Nitrosocosmicus sp.]|nr:hypothetical protein [Candidatus Nitrosocosmicus sp.]